MPGERGHAQVHCRGGRGVGSIVRLQLYTWKNKHQLALPDRAALAFLPPLAWSPTEDKLALTVKWDFLRHSH